MKLNTSGKIVRLGPLVAFILCVLPSTGHGMNLGNARLGFAGGNTDGRVQAMVYNTYPGDQFRFNTYHVENGCIHASTGRSDLDDLFNNHAEEIILWGLPLFGTKPLTAQFDMVAADNNFVLAHESGAKNVYLSAIRYQYDPLLHWDIRYWNKMDIQMDPPGNNKFDFQDIAFGDDDTYQVGMIYALSTSHHIYFSDVWTLANYQKWLEVEVRLPPNALDNDSRIDAAENVIFATDNNHFYGLWYNWEFYNTAHPELNPFLNNPVLAFFGLVHSSDWPQIAWQGDNKWCVGSYPYGDPKIVINKQSFRVKRRIENRSVADEAEIARQIFGVFPKGFPLSPSRPYYPANLDQANHFLSDDAQAPIDIMFDGSYDGNPGIYYGKLTWHIDRGNFDVDWYFRSGTEYPLTFNEFASSPNTIHIVDPPSAPADTHYVSLTGSHTAPYTNWTTAATNIQAAIDAATSGDIVLVTNGVYDSGGLAVYSNMTNRVAITKPVTVRSVNGAEATVIKGQGPIGNSAVRCVYMTNGAVLAGFTLTNGATGTNYAFFVSANGGGVYCESTNAVVSNCLIAGNRARRAGGGAFNGTLRHCKMIDNQSDDSGGGVYFATMENSLIYSNRSANFGGGADDCNIYQCTIAGNAATNYSGGLYNCRVWNSIVYNNSAPSDPNYIYSSFQYSCTTPFPGGVGNLTNNPGFVNPSAGDYHLIPGSACLDAGTNAYAVGNTDLDGTFRIQRGAVDMGCYEASWLDADDSAVHYVSLSGRNIWPYTNWIDAATIIQNAIETAADGDTVQVTNGVYDVGGKAVHGSITNRMAIDKPITVCSVNGPVVTRIQGVGPNGDTAIRCVYMGTNATLIGFTLTNGSTRSDGDVDKEQSGGGVWCESIAAVLSNCLLTGNSAYRHGGGAYGGALYNCILVNNSAASAGNGNGGGACYSALYNCTLTGNSVWYGNGGGGAYSGTLFNCILTSNNSSTVGGGACKAILYNCTLTDNMASYYGGGTYGGTLYNCTLTSNNASTVGGGACNATLYNCIVYYNTAPNGSNYSGGVLNYCCTTPDPGVRGNITNEPMFVDLAAGNLRLLSNSPCINSGTNQDWMINATDLDGDTRIRGERVDMGAYERAFSLMPDDWLARYGLALDGSADFQDNDGDGMDNWREWRCETDPTNRLSLLKCMADKKMVTSAGIVVCWQSVTEKTYRVERSTNLFSLFSFTVIASNIIGQEESTTYTDTAAVGQGPYFYRVGVE
jgi:hypothetical protein